MKPSCGSGPGSWQNPDRRAGVNGMERAKLGRRSSEEAGSEGLGT